MYRTLPYLLLFLVTMLLQIFFFNNLVISIYLCPLVYIAFVVLLPMDTPPVVLLLAGLLSGVVMDWTMGTAGINTISTLFVAFLRPAILKLLCRRDDVREEGVPSVERLGVRVFMAYLIVMVMLHHLVFFSMEALSWTHILHTLLRLIVSGCVSVLFIWFVGRIFTSKFSVRI